jgi:hypothetical protein
MMDCTDILHFHARVLALYGQGYSWAALNRDMALAMCSSDRKGRDLRRCPGLTRQVQ